MTSKRTILENNPFTLIKWSYNPKCKDNIDRKPINCKNITKQENKIKEHSKDSKSHNLFEYTYDKEYCKVWFDIDIDNEANGVDISILHKLLKQFHKKLNEYVETPIDIKNMLVYMKKEFLPNNNVYSIHIIYKDTKIKYDDNSKLMKLLQSSKLNTLTNHLDSSGLYSEARQLCIPYNSKPYSEKITKLGYDNPHKSNDRIFIDYNINNNENYTQKQTPNPREYLMSYVVDSYTTINLKEELNDIIVNTETQTQSKDKYKSKENIDNLPTFWLNEPIKDEIVDIIMSEIDDKFFTKDYRSSWLKIARNLKKLKLSDIQIDSFLKYSAEMSNDTYDYKKNIDWFKNRCNIDNMPFCSYKIICDTLNELSNGNYYFYSNFIKYNKEDMIDFVKDKTGIDCRKKLDTIDYNDIEVEIVEISDNCDFNILTGMLDFEDKRYNYFVEVEYQKHFEPIDCNEYEIVENVNDSEIELTRQQFINKELDLLTCSFKWSCGKSHYIVEPIIKELFTTKHNEIEEEYMDLFNGNMDRLDYELDYKSKLPRVVMLTESNSLNSQVNTTFKNMEHNNFYNHLELKDIHEEISREYYGYDWGAYWDCRRIIAEDCSIITSIESCDCVRVDCEQKLENNETREYVSEIDILVLDEFESICNHFESEETLTNKKSKTKKDSHTQYNHFKRMLEVSRQVIVLDADISKDRINWLENIMKNSNHKFRN